MLTKCERKENGELVSCQVMKDYADSASSHKKGIKYIVAIDTDTMQFKTGVVYKETAKSSGIALNYCPWCGGNISMEVREQC